MPDLNVSGFVATEYFTEAQAAARNLESAQTEHHMVTESLRNITAREQLCAERVRVTTAELERKLGALKAYMDRLTGIER